VVGTRDVAAIGPDSLFEAVYTELRMLARRYLRSERAGHTLQPTALVHEAYLRLTGGEPIVWQNRAQFFSITAQVMRHILVDHARRHGAEKRDRGEPRLSLDDAADLAVEQRLDLVALDEALRKLATLDPIQSQIVELRYFGGMSVPETAEALGISEATVKRHWTFARAWLLRELEGAEPA